MGYLRKALDWVGHGTTAWGLLPGAWQAAITAGLSGMTAYFGYSSGGMFLALLGGAAMFTLLTAAIYFSINVQRMLSVFERLNVEAIVPIQASVVGFPIPADMAIQALTLHCQVRNLSERITYARLRRADHSISGYTPRDRKPLPETVMIILPSAMQPVTLATLPDIKLVEGQEIYGHIELEIIYGPSRDNLCYLLSYKAKPQIGLRFDALGNGSLSLNCAIIDHLHSRL